MKVYLMKMTRYFALCFAFIASHLGFAASTKCPDKSLFETIEDCPWATLTKEAIAGQTPLSVILKDNLWPMIEQDSQKEILKEAWGTSINYDEMEKQVIIQPRIVKELITIFNVNPLWDEQSKLMHAGLQHTYGYLLSNLKTSFGYKRARWVRNELEHGFNLPEGILGPNPKDGTLFSNVSYFLTHLSYRDEPFFLRPFQDNKIQTAIPAELKNYNYANPKRIRLEEMVKIGERTIVIRTDIFTFPNLPADPKSNSALLIYSILDSKEKGPKLISGFPVATSFSERLFQEKYLTGIQTINTRYNAWVEGVTGANPPLKGTRRKVN